MIFFMGLVFSAVYGLGEKRVGGVAAGACGAGVGLPPMWKVGSQPNVRGSAPGALSMPRLPTSTA